MDRKRIEWLFLVVFALIDIYLGIEIWRSPVSLRNNNTDAATDIRAQMSSDGIDLPANISTKQQSGYYLAAKNHDYLSQNLSALRQVDAHYSKDNDSLTAKPKIPLTVQGSKKDILRQLEKFKNNPENVPHGSEFKYEENMSGSANYTYVQTSDYGQVYDTGAQLTFTVNNGQLVSYMMTYLGPVSSVREPQLVVSAWRALKAMYTDREIPNNSRIVRVKLGYSKLTQVRGSTILLPTWLIWVQNKTTKNVSLKRVNAFTAQILQSGSE